MKKFSVPCNFNGQVAPFTIYIGAPKDGNHPLHFQSDWLSKERGGAIPPEVMDSIAKLKDLADKNNVSFEDLCVYALGAAQQEEEENKADPENTIDPETLEPQSYADEGDDYTDETDDEDYAEAGEGTSDGGVKVATAKIPADQANQG